MPWLSAGNAMLMITFLKPGKMWAESWKPTMTTISIGGKAVSVTLNPDKLTPLCCWMPSKVSIYCTIRDLWRALHGSGLTTKCRHGCWNCPWCLKQTGGAHITDFRHCTYLRTINDSEIIDSSSSYLSIILETCWTLEGGSWSWMHINMFKLQSTSSSAGAVHGVDQG